MASLAQLRIAAKALGVSGAQIRSARTPEALMAAIAEHTAGATTKAPAKKSSLKPAARKKVPQKAPVKKAASTRPVKKASRPVEVRPRHSPGEMGRNVLGEIDFNQTRGWNAREGSAPDRIVKALRRYKGDRVKVFDSLSPDIWDFMGKVKRDGSRRTKAEAETMLRYRIARTAWDFARLTDQHEISTNRSNRKNGAVVRPKARAAIERAVRTTPAPAKKASSRATQAPVEAPKRRGRPPGSKRMESPAGAKAVTPTAEAPKRRGPGRPPGSKNKPKLTMPVAKAPVRKKSKARG